jgi:hypothetical protein
MTRKILKVNVPPHGANIPLHFLTACEPKNAMTDSDLNIWGELVVPVGLLICFGPALALWFVEELKASKQEKAAARAERPENRRR